MSYILTDGRHYLVQEDSSGLGICTNMKKAYRWKKEDAAINVAKNIKTNKILSKYHFNIVEVSDERLEVVAESVEPEIAVSKRKNFSQEERAEVYRKTKGHCYLCGDFVDYNRFEVEHRVPISKGGTNELINLFCSCHVCNSIKRDIYPEDFMETITKIFLYQMENKHGKKISWKMMSKKIHKMLG